MKFIIEKTGSLILSILKLDPVKLAVYHLTKEIVIHGAKALSKSTKNTLDDKIVENINQALRK
jgi:hypothetical protein